jgi:hypothetical protein
MSSPTDGELAALVNGPDPFGHLPRAVQLWLAPVKPVMPVLQDSMAKPIGQYTMTELLAWSLTIAYITGSLALVQALTLNLIRVAVIGR